MQSNLRQYVVTPLKMFGTYLVFILIFTIFAGSLAGYMMDHPWSFYAYCSAILLLYTMAAYADGWALGDKERKPYFNANPYPLKGAVLGLITAIPIIVVQIISLSLNWKVTNLLLYRIVHQGMIAPFSAFEANFSESFPFIYVIISIYIPVVFGLAYFAGLKSFSLSERFIKLTGIKPKPVKKKNSKKFR